MAFVKISEQPSLYNDLEKKSVGEIIHDINEEDKKVAFAVEKDLPANERLVSEIDPRMKRGG
ncbi:MAG: N-acetylmuramic acid 6-phosphate etherase, partial [Muribaculaceae bacterium]|nr:N-acetylmuramic acid 6-phosphate etherase [Muribaculaceae bacterium]